MTSKITSKFFITHLYQKELSIYGDQGNILTLCNALKQIGWEYEYQQVNIGSKMPQNTDFLFIGGGQDRDQSKIVDDLFSRKKQLTKLINEGCAMLAICGGYQLFGKEFIDSRGEIMTGLDVFPVITRSPDAEIKSRCIGNLVIESKLTNSILIGFENHGGQTYFTQEASPLGTVLSGFGNNFKDKHEGCVYKNAIGTYLHGSCLPKNPELTQWLINAVLETKKSKGQISLATYHDLKNSKWKTDIALQAKSELIKRLLG